MDSRAAAKRDGASPSSGRGERRHSQALNYMGLIDVLPCLYVFCYITELKS